MFGEIVEVVVYVQDMQKMVEFYRDTLKLTVTYPVLEDYSDQHWVTFQTGTCTLALHSGGKDTKDENAPAYTFSTNDAHQAKSYLSQMGVEVSEIVEPVPGTLVFHAWDPEGNHFSVKSKEI